MTKFLHFSATCEVKQWLLFGCRNSQESWGRTEPDLHLIKQMEQVTTLFWKLGVAPCFG
jgi:hypothetical protein